VARFPVKVKRRDTKGAIAEILCDTAHNAKDVAKGFRNAGYTDVWIEDVDGVPVDEGSL
jgi:hypothetical protein